MGHDSTQAAIMYQHATAEADQAIAQAVDKARRADRKKAKKGRSQEAEEAAQLSRRCGGPQCLMARGWPEHRSQSGWAKAQAGEHLPDLGLVLGAGDGNRTRTVSLGS
jgi:hypothetical protein